MCGNIILGIVGFFLPPLAVCIRRGCCSADSLINVLLCALGWLPGVIHAWYILAKFPQRHRERCGDVEGGRRRARHVGGGTTYYYIDSPVEQGRVVAVGGGPAPVQHSAGLQQPQQAHQPASGQQVYGSIENQASSSRYTPEEVPPSYNEAVRGDHKIQSP